MTKLKQTKASSNILTIQNWVYCIHIYVVNGRVTADKKKAIPVQRIEVWQLCRSLWRKDMRVEVTRSNYDMIELWIVVIIFPFLSLVTMTIYGCMLSFWNTRIIPAITPKTLASLFLPQVHSYRSLNKRKIAKYPHLPDVILWKTGALAPASSLQQRFLYAMHLATAF